MKISKSSNNKQTIKLNKKEWQDIGKKAGWMRESQGESRIMEYFINLDERGEFFADVRDAEGNTVYEIKGFEVFEDGWMTNKYDLSGLNDYLVYLGIMKEEDDLVKGN